MSTVNERRERRRSDRRQGPGRRGRERAGSVKPRVLLIEPHEDTRYLYANLFEDAGYAVYSVADAAEAMALAQHRLPDLIIMEVVLPRVDGLTILRCLREESSTRDIPVIVVTATLHYDLPKRAQTAGATIVLSKPTSVEQLLIAADDLIESTPDDRFARRHLRRALLTIRKLALHINPDERTRDRIRALIDRLQIAVIAIDDGGNYLAASRGVTTLTGYTRAELLTMSIFDTAFGVTLPLARVRENLTLGEHDTAKTAINSKDGRAVTIHASFATILPGLHAAVMARSETLA